MDKRILVGLGIVTVGGVAGLLAVNPDLSLRLRSQVVGATEEPSSISKTLTWTPSADTVIGEQTITIAADDGRGGVVEEEVVINVEGGSSEITDVVITPEQSQATVSWRTTSSAHSPRVDFGLNDELGELEELANEIDGTEHEIVVKDLIPCTTYTMRIAVQAAAGDVIDNLRSFTTQGCAGESSVRGVGKDSISSSQERVVSLPGKIDVRVPAGAVAADGFLQIHQLDRDVVLAAVGAPEGDLSPVTGLYQLSAYRNAKTQVTDFAQPVSVQLAYTPTEDTDMSSLSLWRHDGSSWSQLSDCAVDEGARVVSCATTVFSAVAGFATGGSSGDEDAESETGGGGDNGGGGGGGDGGGGGSSGGEESPSTPARGFVYQVERGWQVTGPHSGVQGNVVKIASDKDLLSHTIIAPAEDYYFFMKARHDRPGPVMATIYVAPREGKLKAWKTVRLDRNDDRYYAHQLGVLSTRDFPGGVYQIGIRLVNDNYDRNNPAEESTDRNLWVDWVILANRPSLSAVRVVDRSTVTANSSGGGVTSGGNRSLLPSLNSVLRSEGIPVTLDNWRYYAWRLTRPVGNKAAISSETQLRMVMRYWRGVQPNQPRGDIIN